MKNQIVSQEAETAWLTRYYFLRFAVSAFWVGIALTLGKDNFGLAAALLVAYPAWDALANFLDAERSGGLGANKSQLLNFVVSTITAIAVAIAVTRSNNDVLFVFGLWAGFAGALQLVTAVRRWKSYGAQWAMILSGAQSVFAATHFIQKSATVDAPTAITQIPIYAAFGALYFAISAIWLAVSTMRSKSAAAVSRS
jgi:uncharacterized membrane protein HdeD (DUF308 family)